MQTDIKFTKLQRKDNICELGLFWWFRDTVSLSSVLNMDKEHVKTFKQLDDF